MSNVNSEIKMKDFAESLMDCEEIGDINERLKQMEEEARKIREMKVDFTSIAPIGKTPLLKSPFEGKAIIDNRSIFVGNVDYSSKPKQLEEYFRECGSINRVTIPSNKYTKHPKGFAYIEFSEADGKQNALALNESLFLGRQLKVIDKRTNKPGISSTNRPPFRGRGRAMGRFSGFRRNRSVRYQGYHGFPPY